MKTKTKKVVYSIKNLKTFYTPDGGGFNCTLYKDGKKIADVHEAGHGGEIDLFGIGHKYSEDVTEFEKYCRSQTWEFNGEVQDTPSSPDIVIGDLVEEFETEKSLKRWSKTKTVFRLKGMKKGEYRTFKGKINSDIVKFIRDKYKDEVEMIYGEEVTK